MVAMEEGSAIFQEIKFRMIARKRRVARTQYRISLV